MSCGGVDEIAEERGSDVDVVPRDLNGLCAAEMGGVPSGVRHRVVGYPRPDELIGVKSVRDVRVPGKDDGGKRRADVVVLEDVWFFLQWFQLLRLMHRHLDSQPR